jgi:plasmid stabilization system protein ParE
MARRVLKRIAAKRDLIEHFVYLAENAGMGIADRFLISAEESFVDLSKHPLAGGQVFVVDSRLAGIRKRDCRYWMLQFGDLNAATNRLVETPKYFHEWIPLRGCNIRQGCPVKASDEPAGVYWVAFSKCREA